MAPQPKESLEAIYMWVGDWVQTWAGIYSWWKYINENKLSIPKVHDTNLHDMTGESAIQQNKVILVVIAIADLCWPEGQRRFHINDVFEDYQEWVEERACLEAERLAKAPSVHTQGQTARDKGQDHTPEDTEGHPSRGAAHSTGGGSGSTSKGKGKQKATSEEDELADKGDGKGEGEPGPSAKGPHMAGDNEPCEMCAQVNLTCVREPELSCKWCQKAKCLCLCSCGVGRKQKNSGTIGEAGLSHKQVKSITTSKVALAEPATGPAKKLTLKILAHKWQPDPTPTCSPFPQLTPSPHDPLPTPHLFFHRATPTPGPLTLPDPRPSNLLTLPFDEPQIEFEPFSAIETSLLNEPGGTKELVRDNTPSGTEIPEVEIPHEQTTASFVEHLRVLKVRAKDKEFELEQIYWLLEMLARQVTYWIETVQARQEEL
ncbi:hypothetical protein M404DRAFT_30722 [Pisolithus tinctorius Marx 270]|uniref:Uncharacterized protein n=1 Tax=Pisolithus tinctorius Marx 270 TaxID=870435 RepID=A0A0C3NV62_PISTI|nr:hypothetical protein M404DRAFT_30722 [Pisolithus tinctorius Marx 270]